MNGIEKLGFDNWFKDKIDLSPKGLGGVVSSKPLGCNKIKKSKII